MKVPAPEPGQNEAQAEWFFHTRLVRWGLRGDPVLWDRFRAHFAQSGISESEVQFALDLGAAFRALTDQDLQTAPDTFGVQALRRKEGGMSNGIISTATWKHALLPLLIARHRQYKAPGGIAQKPVDSFTYTSFYDPEKETQLHFD